MKNIYFLLLINLFFMYTNAYTTTVNNKAKPIENYQIKEDLSKLIKNHILLVDTLKWQEDVDSFNFFKNLQKNALVHQYLLFELIKDTPDAYSKIRNKAIEFADNMNNIIASSAYFIDIISSPNYTPSQMEQREILLTHIQRWSNIIIKNQKALNKLTKEIPNQQFKSTDLAIGKTFKDCDQKYCQKMIVIPQRKYFMGETVENEEKYNIPEYKRVYEQPRHPVKIISPIAVAKYEVTVEAFEEFQKETNKEITSCSMFYTNKPGENHVGYYISENGYRYPGFKQTKTNPVVCISWEDAVEYTKWLSKKTGQIYRLPYENEWEYFSRAGNNSSYPWTKSKLACYYANVYDESSKKANNFSFGVDKKWIYFNCNDGYPNTAPVGKFKSNDFGIYDTIGNAREWVYDCWHENYLNAPKKQSMWIDNGYCSMHIPRGGAWNYMPINLRYAYRDAYPSYSSSNMWGFRVVRELKTL